MQLMKKQSDIIYLSQCLVFALEIEDVIAGVWLPVSLFMMAHEGQLLYLSGLSYS